MKIYCFNDPIFKGSKIVGNVVQEYTRQDILDEYWSHWKRAMEKKFGPHHELITEDNCITDWKAVNWAWELNLEDKSGTQAPPSTDDR